MPTEWNGKGTPPSREAAIDYMVRNGVPRGEAVRPGPTTLTDWGSRARRAVQYRREVDGEPKQERKRSRDDGWNGKGTPPSKKAAREWLEDQGIRSFGQYWTPGSKKWDDDARNLAEVGANARSVAAGHKRLADKRKAADKNRDGKVSDDEKADAKADEEKSEYERFLGGKPGGELDRGEPLLPFEGTIPEDFTVENRSTFRSWGSPFAKKYRQDRVGPRYYDADTLEPLKWSEERRAQLQRELFAIGLYGDKRIRLGSWTAADQGAYAELLEAANVDGRRWQEQLRHWQRVPPEDILERIKAAQGQKPPKPTIALTNPIDIEFGARKAAAQSIGYSDPEFSKRVTTAFHQRERDYQRGLIADADSGGGGEVVGSPSLQAFAEQMIQNERPVESTGYRLLMHFNTLLQRLGAAG